MFTVIIGALFGILFCIYLNVRYKEESPSVFFNCFMGLLAGALLGLVIAYILPMKTVINETVESIEAMQDKSFVNGSFFLGSGQIEGKMKYVMYLKSENTFYMVQLPCEDVSIEYSDAEPSLVTYEREAVKGPLINWFALDDDLRVIGYRVRVPKGTIKANYSLDAQ